MQAHNSGSCINCGMPKTSVSSNGEICFLRCKCDYQRELLDRTNRTIGKSYKGLSMKNWDPDIYKDGNEGQFKNYIKVQRLVVLLRLWEYCFKPTKENGKVAYALQSSVESGKNLFIRGPAGSGRGLLSACIKMVAAIKGISTTPLPCDFSVFKNEVQESELQSRIGEDTRIAVESKYFYPSLLVLENVRAESQIDYQGRRVPRKIRGSGTVDNLLAKRSSLPCGMLITSHSFIGEIADTLGDMMMDVLISEKTSPIVLLSPKESDAILWTLEARKNGMLDVIKSFRIGADDKKDKKLTQERIAEKITLSVLEDALYFEEVFQNIPSPSVAQGSDIHEQFKMYKFEESARAVWDQFCKDKERKSLAYEKGRDAAMLAAIGTCKDLPVLSDKERLEVGKISSKATLNDMGWIRDTEEKSKTWLSDMGA